MNRPDEQTGTKAEWIAWAKWCEGEIVSHSIKTVDTYPYGGDVEYCKFCDAKIDGGKEDNDHAPDCIVAQIERSRG